MSDINILINEKNQIQEKIEFDLYIKIFELWCKFGKKQKQLSSLYFLRNNLMHTGCFICKKRLIANVFLEESINLENNLLKDDTFIQKKYYFNKDYKFFEYFQYYNELKYYIALLKQNCEEFFIMSLSEKGFDIFLSKNGLYDTNAIMNKKYERFLKYLYDKKIPYFLKTGYGL